MALTWRDSLNGTNNHLPLQQNITRSNMRGAKRIKIMINANDSPKSLERRVFIKGLGFVSLGLFFNATLGGCERLLQQINNRPVRRRLRPGSSAINDTIAIYTEAVNIMKGLPSNDPRSWTAQAALHGSVAGGFNFCQHGTSHFFSWHRAYLYFFEKICQELTGDPQFGLPYWNWNQNPQIYPTFLDATSSLFHPRTNVSVAGNAAFNNSNMNTILGDSNFFTFSSQIEGSPHNIAHIIVGGDMATEGSPLDPVFWSHHCMVDYCWAKWNIELENDNTNDAGWNDTSWDHFVRGNGSPATATAGATVIMPLLNYRYESSAVGSFGATAELSTRSSKELELIEKRLKRGANIRFEIKKRIPIARGTSLLLSRPFSARTQVAADEFRALIESDQKKERIFVRINYAQLPEDGEFFVRVFINRTDASKSTQNNDTHYAGSFAFFGTRNANHDGHHPKTDFLVDVTSTLQRLKRKGLMRDGNPLSVQLVAVPTSKKAIKPDSTLTLEDIEFIISPISVKSK
jgi:tyrosinase